MEMDEIPILIKVSENDFLNDIIDLESVRKNAVPVTIITGFLGSGKTTLLMRLINDPNQTRKIAVILNEFGSSMGIDKSLVIGKDGQITEEWLELANGCFCCSVKDAGVKAIENLLKKNREFDCVLLETTGLADPGPIASMFWLDEALQSELYLDGIITVVDAKFLPQYLQQEKQHGDINEAIKQIALADRIVINKADLVSEQDLQNLENKIRSINSIATLLPTSRGNVPIDFIFDLHSFDHQHTDPFTEKNIKGHSIDPQVSTVFFTLPEENRIDRKLLDKWLQSVLWEKKVPNTDTDDARIKPTILRFKALINMDGSDEKHVVQAVQELFDVQTGSRWGESEKRESRIVFIGKDLDRTVLKTSFLKSCLG